jgi:DNA mismatch repair protein MutS
MMQQYFEIKRAHPGKLLFFRLGDFYELFYDDAVVAARELHITLTARNRDKKGDAVPMCGVPYHSVDGYVARLIKKGFKIAICEQVEDPKKAKKLVRREVTRVITPGTIVEENLLEPKENNYLAALFADGNALGVAFLDLSTGEFKATEFAGDDAWEKFQYQLAQFQPRELVHPEMLKPLIERQGIRENLERVVKSPMEDWLFNHEYAARVLLEHFKTSTLDGFGLKEHPYAVSAAGGLLYYVRDLEKSQLDHITEISYFEAADYLKLDLSTVANLELLRALDGSHQATLFAVLDSTKTRMGARLLKNWIIRPILDVAALNARLDAVADLKHSVVLQDQLGKLLRTVYDIERLMSKITIGTANGRDLVSFRSSIKILPQLKEFLQQYKAPRLVEFQRELDDLADIHRFLETAVTDEPPVSLNEGGLIRDGYHAELDELRDITRHGKSYIASIETKERARTGIASLKVRYNQVFGYFIEVTKPNLHLVPSDYIRKQTIATGERFITEELKQYEEKVLTAEERIFELEKELFVTVRQSVAREAGRVKKVAKIVSELDALSAFAEAAVKHKYVRPELYEGDSIIIKNGRHPVVEHQSQPFIPNDLTINTTTDQLLLITGPNMGGKSVFLRQAALIVILAQIGSFVPATEARIGIVDQIFTRVGASDNLARGCSTFMQEMIETANILNTASPRSLILLDEVGRGTATFDGLSIAWAVAEYLHNQSARRAKTLFATHYYELTKLANVLDGVKNYCMAVKESGKEILFMRKVIPGVADRSYGIEVARLAGLPLTVVQRARDILKKLERREIDLSGGAKSKAMDEVVEEIQKSLF